ncbi:MAG: ABC transporter permease [Treponemataceae bacterium]|nr:ABC transporter permease [Treponemataceae bacterium]
MIWDILVIAAPGIILALGALAAEYAGVMTIFLEGFINIGAFCCFAFVSLFENVFLGIICSCAVCFILVYFIWQFVQKTAANIFLVGAGINLFSAGLIPLISNLCFKTSGVISANFIAPDAFFVRNGSTVLCFILCAVFIFAVQKTSWGLSLRICGEQKEVLIANSIKPETLQCHSWLFAACCAGFAGCIMCIRLQSFVPNMSAGRGWIALAAVFLGCKKSFGVVAAALLFAVAEYASNRLQGTYALQPSFMLTVPYIVALLLFLIMPSKKSR